MKAVLIAETSEVIDGYRSFLEENGIDVIVYRWLLKALDNLEEIQPHIVMISVTDFPRHWKTLTQYANTRSDSSFPFIVLIDAGKMASADKVKAEMLGIKAVIDDINSSESQSVLKELISFISPTKTEDSDSSLKELKEAVQSADALNGKTDNEDICECSPNAADSLNVDEDEPGVETAAYEDTPAAYDEEPAVEASEEIAEQPGAFEPTAFQQTASLEQPSEQPAADETSYEPASFEQPAYENAAYEEPAAGKEAEITEEDPDKPNWDEPIFTTRHEEHPEVKVLPISFIYTNPVDKSIVTGKVISYIYPVLFFEPDHKEALNNVRFGQILENCTMKENGNLITIRAQVRGIDTDSIEFCILK